MCCFSSTLRDLVFSFKQPKLSHFQTKKQHSLHLTTPTKTGKAMMPLENSYSMGSVTRKRYLLGMCSPVSPSVHALSSVPLLLSHWLRQMLSVSPYSDWGSTANYNLQSNITELVFLSLCPYCMLRQACPSDIHLLYPLHQACWHITLSSRHLYNTM